MKLTVTQSVLSKALDKGAIAAVSEVAQGDTSNLSLLIQAVKITADKKFTVESTTNLMAVKYSIDAKPENGIEVKEPGTVLIPAKEFINWVKIQNPSATIAMSLSKLANPETINPLEDIGEADDAPEFAVTKIGSVKFVSKDKTKTGGKWELNCYDPEEFKGVNFNAKSNKHFDAKVEMFAEAMNKVMFAALKQDFEHLLDNVSIQTYNNNVYLATTDTKRCALYKVPGIDSIDCGDPLLIPASLLDQVIKISDKENDLTLSYSEDLERIFIKQPNLEVRIASAEKENITKFPNVGMLLQKPYKLLADMSKGSFSQILVSAAIVNNSSALFSFKKDGADVAVKAISEDGKYKPCISKTKARKLQDDVKVVWGVKHLIEGLGNLKDEDVVLEVPSNKKSVKITSPNDDNFQYFAMALKNPIYEAE